MIVAFTLFALSFVGIVMMLSLQLHKMNSGKSFVFFRSGEKLDQYLQHKVEQLKATLSFFNRKTASLLFHLVLDKIEAKAIKLKEVGHSKANELLEKAKAKETKLTLGKKASEFISKIKRSKSE